MTKKLYAIGDVHGCMDALAKLLVKIGEDKGDDEATIVFLGDYVDRGPDSALVIQTLIDLQNFSKRDGAKTEYVFLRGNHEDMMLSGDSMWYYNGGGETVNSYNAHAIDMKEHLDWIKKHTVLTHREGEYFFAHAGIDPGYPLNDQIESTVIWSREFNKYVGEFPENVFVVHGHTPVPEPLLLPNQLNIDTGCVFGKHYTEYGNLTAAVLHNGRDNITFIQSREIELSQSNT